DRSIFPKEPPPGPPVEQSSSDDSSNALIYGAIGLVAVAVFGLFIRRRQVVRRRALHERRRR
ncbi:MAG TPA: hypothetical protein VKA41_11435, partial [Solirubrobacterales bacterium]|nr:hypothetical protein [Solirubrobacterales bacterium]